MSGCSFGRRLNVIGDSAQRVLEDRVVVVSVTEGYAGRRVAAVLAAELPALGRKGAKELIAQGRVRVDGQRLRKDVAVSAGARLEVEGWADRVLANPDLALRVAHEREDWAVVDKPAGMACHPLRTDESDTLANAILARFPEAEGVGHGPLEPGLVHRIDVDTSGAVLIARTAHAFDALSAALESGNVYKEYIAICAGTPRLQTIDAPIGNHPSDKRRAAVRIDDDTDAKPTTTELIRVVPRGVFCEVHVRADKATRHQVRVHLSWIGHPLVGDVLYGGPSCALGRHLLHASCIAVESEGKRLEVRVPLPDDVEAFLAKANAATILTP